MGGMYGKGFLFALKKACTELGVDPSIIVYEADFAPFQPDAQLIPEGIDVFQFYHEKDKVAGYEKIKGATYMNTSSAKNQGHSIVSFIDQIENLPPGKYKIVSNQIVPY